jgi:hypothetical protein
MFLFIDCFLLIAFGNRLLPRLPDRAKILNNPGLPQKAAT